MIENSKKIKLFKENLVFEGRHHLRNIGNGEVEALACLPYSDMGNVVWNMCKCNESRINWNNEMKDFELNGFPE